MKDQWRLIDTGPGSAAFNMALDEAMASDVMRGASPPTLRFYTWAVPSVSIGCFQRVGEIDLEYCSGNSIPLVRRPTGGRAILHHVELTCSFSGRNNIPVFSEGLLRTYGSLSRAFYRAFRGVGLDVEIKTRREKGRVLTGSPLCFQSVSYGEISLGGKKVMGSAQKRWKEGFLQQGSIKLRVNPEEMEKVFMDAGRDNILSSMTGILDYLPDLDPADLKERIREAFEEIFEVKLTPLRVTDSERDLALDLLKKYRSQEWMFRR